MTFGWQDQQIEYNRKNKITPKTIEKNIKDITEHIEDRRKKTVSSLMVFDVEKYKKAPKKTIMEKERKIG